MESSAKGEQTVCVTGGSGFIGSWIVFFLLQRGYRVRATVQSKDDEQETGHLLKFEGAHERLELFQADLLDYQAIASAIGKSVGVFHVASPCFLHQPKDPQKELLEPAKEGTLNVLKASHKAGVKRVVLTSSVSAMYPNPRLPAGVIVDENSWTDIKFCEENEAWYPISKTLAEEVAWKFSRDTGLNVVAINPGCVLGKMLQPRLNASVAVLLNLLQGASDPQTFSWIGIVNVKDVAIAHILLFEKPNANGRHLCTIAITHFSDFADKVAQLYPRYNVCRFKEDTHPDLIRLVHPSKKLLGLGFAFTPEEEAIKDAVLSLQEKGHLEA
ncbi:hypothetical protein GOP47_0022622 [Adiantum capillus-veneris]|uniref:NAD-dependent epimerase/dehydratase domain-containing protein n=1 Tax=Adiantum capillus-veneris TaxID=13818 RepID=A0A9D4U5X3_ADICA|nr:hypothetical protein GOP47_0022622 [Adiantum capillus-veneris]